MGERNPGVGRAYLVMSLAILGMATSGSLIRASEASPAAVVFFRAALAAPWLLLIAGARRERFAWGPALGAAGFLVVHWLLWAAAVQQTTIATAGILVSTGALWSALLSAPLLGERVTRRHWLGLAIAFAGVALILTTSSGGNHTLRGDLYALASAVAWVGYAFIGRRARAAAGFFSYVGAVYGATAVLGAAAAPLLGQSLWPLSMTSLGILAAVALLPTLLGHGGMNYALKHIGPAQLGLWTLGEPALGTLIAVVAFGEIPGPQVIAGGLLTLVGVGVGSGLLGRKISQE